MQLVKKKSDNLSNDSTSYSPDVFHSRRNVFNSNGATTVPKAKNADTLPSTAGATETTGKTPITKRITDHPKSCVIDFRVLDPGITTDDFVSILENVFQQNQELEIIFQYHHKTKLIDEIEPLTKAFKQYPQLYQKITKLDFSEHIDPQTDYDLWTTATLSKKETGAIIALLQQTINLKTLTFGPIFLHETAPLNLKECNLPTLEILTFVETISGNVSLPAKLESLKKLILAEEGDITNVDASYSSFPKLKLLSHGTVLGKLLLPASLPVDCVLDTPTIRAAREKSLQAIIHSFIYLMLSLIIVYCFTYYHASQQ